MRLTSLRLPALILSLAALAGCGTTAGSCGDDTEYLQAAERPPLQLPPEITPTQRIQPLAIPPVDPTPTALDPAPPCLDHPPRFFARKGAVADSAEDAVRAWAAAWAARKPDAVIQMYSSKFQAAGLAYRTILVLRSTSKRWCSVTWDGILEQGSLSPETRLRERRSFTAIT